MNRRLLFLSVILVAVALLVRFVPLHRDIPLKRPFSQFPLQVNGWTGKNFTFDEVILEKLRVSEYMSREYMNPPHRVQLYVGFYNAQKEGAQIHSPKHCLPGGGWRAVGETTRTATLPGFGPVHYMESVYQKGDEKQVFVYWYQMKNATVTGDYGLKMQMILNSLRYRRNDGAFIRLSAPVRGSEAETVASLGKFMNEVLPRLRECLPD
jgi:EpsI family protein